MVVTHRGGPSSSASGAGAGGSNRPTPLPGGGAGRYGRLRAPRAERARAKPDLRGALGQTLASLVAASVAALSIYVFYRTGIFLGAAIGEMPRPGWEGELPHDPETLWPRPEGWETMTYEGIRKHLQCLSYADDRQKTLPTLAHWQLFREKFRENANGDLAFDDPIPPTKGYTMGNGEAPPFYAKHGARGLGLFASRVIWKGELVHDGDASNIEFPNALAWRKFIFSLPRNRACDNMDWMWTQRTEEDGPVRILSAMNISVLFNGASNWNANANPESSTSSKFYATRHIHQGEELLTQYGIYPYLNEEVGL